MKYLLLLVVMLLVSCSVNPSKVDSPEKFIEKITYTKDERTGVCFAIIATRKTMRANQSGMGFACVPCEKVEKFLE